MNVADCPPDRRSALRASAEPKATDYHLVSWSGRTPEIYLDQTAQVEKAMSDAPRNPGMEATVWDTERIRAAEQAGLDRGVGFFAVAAMHAGTGEIAALTEIADIGAGSPGWGEQLITAVTRPHRGHRLGLLVKLAMLDLLAEQAPRMRWIVTSNAELNQHMIAINEQLGYRITGRFLTWQLDLAAASSGTVSQQREAGQAASR
jgi:RimJ/RimL family protein N-acetyltransferase